MNHPAKVTSVQDDPSRWMLYALVVLVVLVLVLGAAAYVWVNGPTQHRHSGCHGIPLVEVHGKLQPAYPCRTTP